MRCYMMKEMRNERFEGNRISEKREYVEEYNALSIVDEIRLINERI